PRFSTERRDGKEGALDSSSVSADGAEDGDVSAGLLGDVRVGSGKDSLGGGNPGTLSVGEMGELSRGEPRDSLLGGGANSEGGVN
ncbi:MAG: hypothetical protein ACE1Y4_02990, partial [Lysobacterales bacterium]